jgi:hypothetical protein
MIKTCKCDKDTYIVNRVINGVYTLNANIGAAGTLDLYKLYGFSSSESVELSRLLIHFDLNPLRELINENKLDISNASFNAKMILHDVYGGQPTPSNFTIDVFPLSASFSEGSGRDIIQYSDIDACNWLTSSFGSTTSILWVSGGCTYTTPSTSNVQCDYFSDYKSSQTFKSEEDLTIDVTQMVSATLSELIPDEGFRIAFSSTLENDNHTYFVKRFATRSAYDKTFVPELVIKFDNSILDDSQNAFIDAPTTLFLYNYVGNSYVNIISGSTDVTNLTLKLVTTINTIQPISSTVIYSNVGPFKFLPTSSVAFTGSYKNITTGSALFTTGTQLIGSMSGTFTNVNNVLSGNFTLTDGITPVLSGPALFSGTLNNFTGTFCLTGSYVPDGVFLFSGSYASSATMGYAPYVLGPFSASQFKLGTIPQVGIYSSSFKIITDQYIALQLQQTGSVSLTPIWGSNDGSVRYSTGSVISFYPPQRGSKQFGTKRFVVNVLGLSEEYTTCEMTTLRVNIFDYSSPLITVVRVPVELPGIVIRDVHYQVRDVETNDVKIPFDTTYNSTRVSSDATGMFFELDTSNLVPEHTYVIDVLIKTNGVKQIYKDAGQAFRVTSHKTS